MGMHETYEMSEAVDVNKQVLFMVAWLNKYYLASRKSDW